MFKHLKWKKTVPLVVIIVLAYLCVGTSVFSVALQNEMIETGKSFLKGLIPLMGNIFVGLIVLCLAYALFDPLKEGLAKLISLSKHADERGRRIVTRVVVLSYWGFTIALAISFIAPDLLTKLLVGLGAVGVALGLAMQGVVSDWFGGVVLNFRPKFCLGDEVEVNGLTGVKGKVIDIGLQETVIELPDGIYFVPNREIMARALKVTKNGPVNVTTDGIIIRTTGARDDRAEKSV